TGAAPGAAGSAQAGAETGEGGVAGMPHVPTAGEECTACGASECTDELDACNDNPECAPWLACISACADESCIDACDASHADVSRIYYGVYACLCDQCETECAAGKACDKQCVDDVGLPTGAAA